MANNTDLADVNEILLGYFLAGQNWNKFSQDAKTQHDTKAKLLTAEEYEQQSGRARVMAVKAIEWAKSAGYGGNITNVWWTARPGSLSEAVNSKTADQKKNPTDILIKFERGPANYFLGLSAKSTKGKTDIGFKNPGLGTVESDLKIDLKFIDTAAVEKIIGMFNLPRTADARKSAIRKDPVVQRITDEIGKVVLSGMRDKFLEKLKTMNKKDLLNYIMSSWIDASEELYPPYVKVTGMGKNAPYTATVSDPLNNEKLKYLYRYDITLDKVGNDSVGVKAGGKQILKMRFKYESEKLASSVKLSGDPW